MGCGRAQPHFGTAKIAESEERTFSDLARKARVRELEEWGHFRGFSPAQTGNQSKDLTDARCVLTWNEGEGEETVKARLVATEYQDPDLRMGNVDIAGCVSRRSSNLPVISLEVPKKWPLWGLDIKNAFLQKD